MPVDRTPPNSQFDVDTNKQEIIPTHPSSRLGAVTRKKNEIAKLLVNPTERNKRQVPILYEQLNDKRLAFHDSCENAAAKMQDEEQKKLFIAWCHEKQEEITSDSEAIRAWIKENPSNTDILDNIDSVSKTTSRTSKKSKGSSISSAKIRLAEEKARLEAEQRYFEKQSKLELNELKIAQEKKKLEFEKQNEIQNAIEKALDNIEKEENRSVVKSTSSSKNSSNMQHLTVQSVTQDNVLQTILTNQERALLPANEPEKFDGKDCSKYPTFQLTFEQQIASKCTNDKDKFFYLQKYTTGHPHELVKSCHSADPAKSYEAAKNILNKHYGNEFKISSAYLKKIEDFPAIKNEDGEALEDFALLLLSCKNLMANMTSLNQLNSHSEITQIIKKLPFKLRERWRRIVHKITGSGKNVVFNDLVEYVYEEAEVCNTPMCQDIRDQPAQKRKTDFSSKAKSFTVKSKNENKELSGITPCHCCKKSNHGLNECYFFGKKSLQEKYEFIKRLRLCMSCLKIGHFKGGCKNPSVCLKCKSKHPTCLHYNKSEKDAQEDKREKKEEKQETKQKESSTPKHETSAAAAGATCVATTTSKKMQQNGRIVCPAVPIKILVGNDKNSKFITTYMALDTWSTDSFMDMNLLNKIGLQGHEESIPLTTMGGQTDYVSVRSINNLKIYSLDETNESIIPLILAKEDWPFTLEDSPTAEDISDFPHLNDIAFNFVSEKIGILLGMNMVELLRPLQIINGRPGEPYASLHSFGWALNGPVGSIMDKRSYFCNRTRVENNDKLEIETKLEELYTADFRDEEAGTLGLSRDDLLWYSRVESSVKITPDQHYEIGLPFRTDNIKFPCNYNQALYRLTSLKTKLEKSSGYKKEYETFINNMLESGYAEEIPVDEIETEPGKCWYLIHFGVSS